MGETDSQRLATRQRSSPEYLRRMHLPLTISPKRTQSVLAGIVAHAVELTIGFKGQEAVRHAQHQLALQHHDTDGAHPGVLVTVVADKASPVVGDLKFARSLVGAGRVPRIAPAHLDHGTFCLFALFALVRWLAAKHEGESRKPDRKSTRL